MKEEKMGNKPLYPHVPKGRVSVSAEFEIPDERIEQLLCDAFEGGSNYWYTIKSFNYPPGQTKKSLGIEFAHLELPLKGGSLTIGEMGKTMPDKVLDRTAIQKGLKIMAEKYPKDYADFLAENDDATTGDVFLQCALYGDVVFA
jgi:hypothetical protein